MTTKPDKQLVQYCEVLMVLSVFSATSFGISNILTICYELGKDASDTFIWFALVHPDLLFGTQCPQRYCL